MRKKLIVRLKFNETQASETKCTEACWTNYPASEAKRDNITIPRSGGYNTPQLAAELFPKLALEFIPVIDSLAATIPNDFNYLTIIFSH
jgi:hypothetical protein